MQAEHALARFSMGSRDYDRENGRLEVRKCEAKFATIHSGTLNLTSAPWGELGAVFVCHFVGRPTTDINAIS